MGSPAQKVRGDKFWRGLALVALCGLVYYFSYDHGRVSVLSRLAAERASARVKLEALNREAAALRETLAACQARAGDQEEAEAEDRFTLRVSQSRLLFDDRVVLTLLAVENLENQARVQLNMIEDGRLTTEEMSAGSSLKFTEDNRQWALILTAMQTSSAGFTLVEVKTGDGEQP